MKKKSEWEWRNLYFGINRMVKANRELKPVSCYPGDSVLLLLGKREFMWAGYSLDNDMVVSKIENGALVYIGIYRNKGVTAARFTTPRALMMSGVEVKFCEEREIYWAEL